jgi:hypothetical protein
MKGEGSVPVTDDQVAALRALLAGDLERHKLLYAQLGLDQALAGYTALVTGAFSEAVERRFGANYRPADVITFVGDVRSRSDRIAESLDPSAAERIIRAVFGDGSVKDLRDVTVVSAQMVLLGALITDEQLDDAGLDAFLTDARTLADRLMTGPLPTT